MTGKTKPQPEPPKRGRPVTREIKLDAAPKGVARAMFSAVKKPDPTRRKPRKLAKPNG